MENDRNKKSGRPGEGGLGMSARDKAVAEGRPSVSPVVRQINRVENQRLKFLLLKWKMWTDRARPAVWRAGVFCAEFVFFGVMVTFVLRVWNIPYDWRGVLVGGGAYVIVTELMGQFFDGLGRAFSKLKR